MSKKIKGYVLFYHPESHCHAAIPLSEALFGRYNADELVLVTKNDLPRSMYNHLLLEALELL